MDEISWIRILKAYPGIGNITARRYGNLSRLSENPLRQQHRKILRNCFHAEPEQLEDV